MKYRIFSLLLLLVALHTAAQEPVVTDQPGPAYFPLFHDNKATPVLVDPSDAKAVHIAVRAFSGDLQDVTGKAPGILNQIPSRDQKVIVIGTLGQSTFIDELVKRKKLSAAPIQDKWEAYSISTVKAPFPGIIEALVIAGSDRRGTAFGVFELSRRIGVSPWKWWADMAPHKRKALYVKPVSHIDAPSVQYRGIFLNDEDWGLQPWAAKKMDTAVRDIGPNTYARIFELMLRLKANYLWPAMHPCTKAFYYYKENPKVAEDYGIVVGSSHCEPMLRNNVFEWAENFEHEYGKKPGEWRYDLNREEIAKYWNDRVKESSSYESVYTVGMRGIHDGSMPGPKALPEKVQLLQKIIDDQRSMLTGGLKKNTDAIPQIFCPYKEVLNVYRAGLRLPDDITIVWADDNHGYIRQLPNAEEKKRSGGHGIYYHLSYWGSPHDYLWLSTISPSLVSFEMSRAYEAGANRLWVFNVGDIKPSEIETQFAMDLAWNVKRWSPEKASGYIQHWAAENFGVQWAVQIAKIRKGYYELAASAKPEHMTSVAFFEEEEDERLQRYAELVQASEKVRKGLPASLQDAYFQVIHYPIEGALLMNRKVIFARRSLQPGTEKATALRYAEDSRSAYGRIQELTRQYNLSGGGKWDGIMSAAPRNLPVFAVPKVATVAYLDSLSAAGAKNVRPSLSAIRIPAEKFTFTGGPQIGNGLRLIDGLGISGKAVALFPFPTKLPASDSSFSVLPFLEYTAHPGKGKARFEARFLPTQSTSGDGKLWYGISVDGGKPTWVNVHAEAESAAWKKNVLRGYSEGSSQHEISSDGPVKIRIYLPQAGLALSEVGMEKL